MEISKHTKMTSNNHHLKKFKRRMKKALTLFQTKNLFHRRTRKALRTFQNSQKPDLHQ